MTTLAKVLTGSRSFGLETDYSDYDYYVVFLPSLKDLLLQKGNYIKKSKDEEENDYVHVDLHKFVSFLIHKDQLTFDVLYAPEFAVKSYSYVWNWLRTKRDEFSPLAITVYLRHFEKRYIGLLKNLEDSKMTWKNLYVYLRTGYQAKSLLKYRYVQFPLENSDMLFKVKQGELDLNEIKEMIINLYKELQDLKEAKDFKEPEIEQYYYLYDELYDVYKELYKDLE